MNRTPLINGIDLASVLGVNIAQIRPDAIPERIIEEAQRATEDGTVVIDSRYGTKMIPIKGWFNAESRAVYEQYRDNMLALLHSDREIDLQFEQSGAMRRYAAIYQNVTFDFIDGGDGKVPFTIQYKSTAPFGTAVDETVIIDEASVTAPLTVEYDTGGSIHTQPYIVLTLNNYDPIDQQTTITISSRFDGAVTSMSITRVFAEGETIVIDALRRRVRVGGTRVPYVGRMPVSFKHSSLSVSSSANSYDIAVRAKINRRYL